MRFDLREPGLQSVPTGIIGNQNTRRTHERVDDVTNPQNELFDVALLLGTEGNEMHIRDLKSSQAPLPRPVLILDPATMLIKETAAVASGNS